MREDYFVVIIRTLPYGSYGALGKVFDDREKADDYAKEVAARHKDTETHVCRIGLPFRYDTEKEAQ